jgi:type II secretory pathway component PulF
MAACRRLVPDARSEAEGAFSYVLAMGLLLLPAVPLLWMTLAVFVFPKLQQILEDYATSPTSGLAHWVLGGGSGMAVVCGVLAGAVYAAAAGYLAGPRLRALWPSWGDRVEWWMPWRRLRLQRDAAGLLGDLLDAGVGEERAVALAARGTANGVMVERAARVTAGLAAGEKLPVAVRWLDGSGELAWRLENARHSAGGFRKALAGWVESLDARAFQREQAMVHLLTTGLVLFNGLVVGVVVTGVFQALMTIVEAGLSW